MKTEMLASAIEVLLSRNRCVTVPGIGGFLLQENSAYINEEGVMEPPRMSVAFNADLLHNDGLLASFWAESFGVSYDEAVSKVAKESADFLIRLKKTPRLRFGYLGMFSLNESGRVQFSNAGQTYITPDYLYYPLIMPIKADEIRSADTIAILKTEDKATAEEVVQVQINIKKKAVFQTVALTAVALFAFFSLVIPAEVAKTSIEKAYFSLMSLVEPIQELLERNKEVEPLTIISSVEQEKDYFVIISSCHDVKEAAQELSFYKKHYDQSGVLENKGKINVYAAMFTNKSDAIMYLKHVRSEQFDGAWLLSRKKR